MFDKRNQMENPEVAECERQIAALNQQKLETYQQIGRAFAESNTPETVQGTPYEAMLGELLRIGRETDFYEKRKLAVQGLRRCEKCGNILVLDSGFCNKCGEKLEPLFLPGEDGRKVCGRCGTPCEAGAVFCTGCGNRLD